MSDTMAKAVTDFDGGVFAQDNSTKTKAATVVDTVYLYTQRRAQNAMKSTAVYFTDAAVQARDRWGQ